MAPLVTASGLGKVYRVYERPWHRLLELVTGQPSHQPFAALSDLSFEVEPGESLGIIGENGAGKSTLLKILSGVTEPTSGTLEVKASVASLLELGMGFHPEFTGRQNIRINAAMMGLGEAEVEAKIPEIIAFSELGEFIDRPVKTYSSGMSMRLGFAIAVQVDPEILIVDEALSVGDGYFQKKCMDRMRQLLDAGRTLIFCSHAMYYVSSFCHRALWLRDGRSAALGPVDEVVGAYEGFLAKKSEVVTAADGRAAPEPEPSRPLPARVTGLRVLGAEDGPLAPGDTLVLEIAWKTEQQELPIHLGVGLNAADGTEVSAFGTHRSDLPPFTGRRRYRARLRIPDLPLVKGDFTVHVFLLDEAGLHLYDHVEQPAAFSVESSTYHFGLVRMPHVWEGETSSTSTAALEPAPRDAQREGTA